MKHRLVLPLLGLGALFATGCGQSAEGTETIDLVINEVSSGFGLLLPHTIFEVDANGTATNSLVTIRTQADLLANATSTNGLRPPTPWSTDAELPDKTPGNHYLYAEFRSQKGESIALDVNSVLDTTGNLKGPITIVSVDNITGNQVPIKGRVFIDGKTVDGSGVLVPWVSLVDGQPFASPGTPGFGYPGTQGGTVPSAFKLVSPSTLVFIPDSDDDLTTHETFPTGVTVRMRITTAVRSAAGGKLVSPGTAACTVGQDLVRPEIALAPTTEMIISPSTGSTDVDPLTDVTVEFTEPIQPHSIGILTGQGTPTIGPAISISFGPSTAKVNVPFSVRVPSVYDMTRLVLEPAFNFPGKGPVDAECGTFDRVDIAVFSGQFQDLAANVNAIGSGSYFFTGEGPGLVNVPVAPDAIYIGRIGAEASISVIDLNGFGAGTGTPQYDITNPIVQGNTNYPNNPNVAQGVSMIPQLKAGSCSFDGGSLGVYTLAVDSSLNDQVLRSPVIESVEDMMLGHALDTVFNNGPPPFGCQAGGGNPCAFTGFKAIAAVVTGSNTLGPTTIQSTSTSNNPGGENIISWSPHPNPPPLVFPPPCLSPFIGGQEPTSLDTLATNLLTPGPFPQGIPGLGVPPASLLVKEQNQFFLGPSSAAQAQSGNCAIFQIRQQIGHFLYVVDSVRREIVVLNSNLMTVIQRIPLADPTSLAISPNLDLLAVTNQSAGVVSFISIDPKSSTFHQVVKEVAVGSGPNGIAWEPGNEDIFVCNEQSNTVTIISAFSLAERKTLGNQLLAPFDVAITPRQFGFGYQRQVYLAYILNGDGSVSVFESGPSGPNGWGFDEIVLKTPYKFSNARAIQPDHKNLNSAVWICHEGQLAPDGTPTGLQGGAVSNLALTSANQGIVPLSQLESLNPGTRDMEFSVVASIGSDVLTGAPVEIAFDNQMNFGGFPAWFTNFSAGSPAAINGKSIVRTVGGVQNTNEPQLMFLAVPNSKQGVGVVDVIQLDTGFTRADTDLFQIGIQSIPAPGARIVMDYFRQ